METLLDLARPWPLKLAVDNAIGGRPLGVLDGLGAAGLAAVAVAAGIGIVAVGALVGYLITYLTAATAERVGADLRVAVFGRLLGLSLPFHDRHRSGDLVTRLTGPPPLPSGRNPEVPAALDRAISCLLAPDPADRPATAAQALALLSAAMPADAAEEDRLWPSWATGRLGAWQASAMERPPLVPRPA